MQGLLAQAKSAAQAKLNEAKAKAMEAARIEAAKLKQQALLAAQQHVDLAARQAQTAIASRIAAARRKQTKKAGRRRRAATKKGRGKQQ